MGTSTDANPTYQYTTPGVYDVTLTVYGLGGTASYTRSGYITVNTPYLDVTLGSVDPAASASVTGLGSYAYNAVGTLLATPTGGGGIDYADIVFLICQENTMSPVAANVPALVTALEAELIANGVGGGATPNNYALVGFEQYTSIPTDVPTKKTVGGVDWGSATQLNTAISALTFPYVITGQLGDGYYACTFALDNYTFRPGAPNLFVLVSNQARRDITGGVVTKASALAALTAANVILSVCVGVKIVDNIPTALNSVFGRDALTPIVWINYFAPPYYITSTFVSWGPNPVTTFPPNSWTTYCLVFGGEYGALQWNITGSGAITGFINAFAELNAARVVGQLGSAYVFDHWLINGTNSVSNPYVFNVIEDTVADVFTSGGAAPAAPVAIDGSPASTTAFDARWEPSVGAQLYRMDVCTDFAMTSYVSNNADVGNTILYPVSGVSVRTPYYYRIRAINDAGTSANSNVIGAGASANNYVVLANNSAAPFSVGIYRNVAYYAAVGTVAPGTIGTFFDAGLTGYAITVQDLITAVYAEPYPAALTHGGVFFAT